MQASSESLAQASTGSEQQLSEKLQSSADERAQYSRARSSGGTSTKLGSARSSVELTSFSVVVLSGASEPHASTRHISSDQAAICSSPPNIPHDCNQGLTGLQGEAAGSAAHERKSRRRSRSRSAPTQSPDALASPARTPAVASSAHIVGHPLRVSGPTWRHNAC